MMHADAQKCMSMMSCARAVGGREAEKEERTRWINRERKRIEDSVNGNWFSCIKFNGKVVYSAF